MFETIIISIISSLATATLTYLGYWRQVQADLKKEYASRFNEQKWKAYKDFMVMQSRMVNSMKPESAEIKVALLLVASDDVIKAYNESLLMFGSKDPEKRRMSGARLIAEMRKDLGYNSQIDPTELWKMFNSIQEP